MSWLNYCKTWSPFSKNNSHSYHPPPVSDKCQNSLQKQTKIPQTWHIILFCTDCTVRDIYLGWWKRENIQLGCLNAWVNGVMSSAWAKRCRLNKEMSGGVGRHGGGGGGGGGRHQTESQHCGKQRLAQSNNSVLTASYDKLDDDEKTFNLQWSWRRSVLQLKAWNLKSDSSR